METPITNENLEIVQVWRHNLEEEIKAIQGIVDEYPFIGMDTEYPGKPFPEQDYNLFDYSNLRKNVNSTKLIQLGLSFCNARGLLPMFGNGKYRVWQFNISGFNPEVDLHVESSTNVLRLNGISFEAHNVLGPTPEEVAAALMPSGAILNDHTTWVTFHGNFDVGYMVKLLKGEDLPESCEDFFQYFHSYFPVLYDLKLIAWDTRDFGGGLDRTAARLGVERIGTAHQAGSDSLLTLRAFIKLVRHVGDFLPEKYKGLLHGTPILERQC